MQQEILSRWSDYCSVQYNDENYGDNVVLDCSRQTGEDLQSIDSLVCCLVIRGSTGGFLLLRYFSGIVSHPGVLRVSQDVSVLISDSS